MFVTLVYLEMLKSDTSQRDAVNVWQLFFSFLKKTKQLVVLVDVLVNIMEQSFFFFHLFFIN